MSRTNREEPWLLLAQTSHRFVCLSTWRLSLTPTRNFLDTVRVIINTLHRSTTYVDAPIVTDPVAWSVCRSVCLSVTVVSPERTAEPNV